MENLKKITEEISKVRKKAIYNYKYSYFLADGNGGMIPDTGRNVKYGDERSGYESFKDEPYNTMVSFSGVTSLRTIKNRSDGEIQGYITERKISNNPEVDKLIVIKEQVRSYIMGEIGVKDEDSFFYYVMDNEPELNFRNNYDSIISQINWWKHLYSEYLDDKNFKKYIDKIVK